MSAEYSVGILAYNGRAFLDMCLASVLAQEPPPAEVVVVDNASTDGSADFVAETYPDVRLIRNETNVGVAQGYNMAAAALSSPLVILLNQDLRLLPGCLAALAETFDAPDVAVVGAKLLYADEQTIQHAGGHLVWPLFLAQHYGYGEADGATWDAEMSSDGEPPVDYVTGAVFAVRKSVWDELGGFDDLFSPAYFEEVDYCWRVKARDSRIVYQPRARAIHFETTTLGKGGRRYLELYHRNRLRLTLKDATFEHILGPFARAEARRTAGLRVSEDPQVSVDLDAVRLAYADTDANLDLILAHRGDAPVSDGTVWALRDMLGALREIANGDGGPDAWRHIVFPTASTLRARDIALATGAVAPPSPLPPFLPQGEEGGVEPLPQPSSSPPSPILGEGQGVRDARGVADLATLRPQPFESHAPVVGPLIVWVRTLWNSVATKWYVQPLVDQQNRFNAATAEALRQIAAGQARDERVLQSQAAVLTTLSQRQALVGAAMAGLAAETEALRTGVDALRFDLDAAMVKDDARAADLKARADALAARIAALESALQASGPSGGAQAAKPGEETL
ncbi:MAG: glycosyltransferase family 2 protein [Anaerolineae bacterium]